jgi:hypothetical protein
MALVTPVEILGLARVSVEAGVGATYDFSNGFDTGTPAGATGGAASIVRNAAGDYTVFLTDAVDAGTALNQGGVTTEATSCGVAGSGADVPTVAFATVEYNPILAGAYALVDREKALRIRFYGAGGTLVEVKRFTIHVTRNPVTILL